MEITHTSITFYADMPIYWNELKVRFGGNPPPTGCWVPHVGVSCPSVWLMIYLHILHLWHLHLHICILPEASSPCEELTGFTFKSLGMNCLNVLRSLHPIEVVGIIAKKKKNAFSGPLSMSHMILDGCLYIMPSDRKVKSSQWCWQTQALYEPLCPYLSWNTSTTFQ